MIAALRPTRRRCTLLCSAAHQARCRFGL
jgi:hypothetical protein